MTFNVNKHVSTLGLCFLLVLVLGFHSSYGLADDASEHAFDTQNVFTAQDIFSLEVAASPQVSPNGKHIVYVRRSHDIMTDSTRSNLWIVNSKGGEHRPLLSSKANYYSPSWSPDGKRLAYVSNTDGKPQIYLRWMATGPAS